MSNYNIILIYQILNIIHIYNEKSIWGNDDARTNKNQ